MAVREALTSQKILWWKVPLLRDVRSLPYKLTSMGKSNLFLWASCSLVLMLVVSFLNLFVFTRDVPLTLGVRTANIERVIDGKEWVESPMQTLATFMGEAVFPNVGDSSTGQFDFIDRMYLVFGDERIGESPIVDVRGIYDEVDMAELRYFLDFLGYSSERTCPHDENLLCEVYVAWNRDRTKEAGMRMIALRFGELEYALVDDSVVIEG